MPRVQYVHLPNFDVASDAFVTLRDLLTRNKTVASDVRETQDRDRQTREVFVHTVQYVKYVHDVCNSSSIYA